MTGDSVLNTAPQSLQNGTLEGNVPISTRVDSNGGTITLAGAEDLFTDATLLGNAGGPSASGGALIVSDALTSIAVSPAEPSLLVTQNQPTIPVANFYPAGNDAIGYFPVNSKGVALPIMGYFALDSFTSGGFGQLTLAGEVEFQGPINLDASQSLNIGTGGFISADSSVTLRAPFVSLGLPFIPPGTQGSPYSILNSNNEFNPSFGPGSLTVIASLIDIGTLSLQDIGNARLIAENGNIQGDGTLDIAGKLTLEAGQVYPPTETTFNINAYDYTDNGMNEPGTVTFIAAGDEETPLSVGGTLNVYATDIVQDGILRAPGGVINLGWDGSGTAPIDLITNAPVEATTNVTLGAGSITSVSEINSLTGQPMIIPYGITYNGVSWIDPAATISPPAAYRKRRSISPAPISPRKRARPSISAAVATCLPISSSRAFWVATIFSPRLRASRLSPAIRLPTLPMPRTTPAAANAQDFGDDAGYVNNSLVAGDQVYLAGEGSLAAGVYTLLPARYALLPGAFLVTPTGAQPEGNQTEPDGSYLVSGYEFNAFQSARTAQPLLESFQVDSSEVINNSAQYNVSLGNVFLASGAASSGATVPRLPLDAGQLVFNATQTMSVEGSLESQAGSGGSGGLVDINSPSNIVITGAGSSSSAPNTLTLNASELSSFGAASLLIGGSRDLTGGDSATVTVSTDSITVDNGSEAFEGADIILVSNDSITVDQGAVIESFGGAGTAEALTVDGNGTLLRVSSDEDAPVTRTGNTVTAGPELTVDSGAKITAGSATFDSSAGMSLDPNAVFDVKSLRSTAARSRSS